MHDAGASSHPVNLARADLLADAETVGVMDLTVEQIGDRRQADMGVRSDVDPFTRAKVGRPHVIQKNEWPNHPSARKRQNAADFQSAAQVLARAFDDQIEHVRLLAPQEEPTATQWALCT